jgi:glycosyltransferase involved in cell wall biosynthesis
MGRAGRARALEEFDWSAIAAQTSDLYRSLA